MSLNLIYWAKSAERTPELGGPGDCPYLGGAGEKKIVAIFILFCMVFIDLGNKQNSELLGNKQKKVPKDKTNDTIYTCFKK